MDARLRIRPLRRSNAAPPPDSAPPEAVFAAFLRAAMEDDRDLAKKLVTSEKVDVAVDWLEVWQRMLRDGLVDAPAAKVTIDGDRATLETAPRNKNAEKKMYERQVELTREKAAWRISQGM